MISEVLAAAGGLGVVAVPAAVALRRVRAQLEQLREAYQLARFEATHDDLTGLANRRAFYEAAAGSVASANPERTLALVMVDVDAFKAINDTYGHGVGDLVLRSVAHQLDARVPHGLVARLAGDEFVVLVELRCGESAADVGSAVADASDGVDVDEPALAVTFSVGVAELYAPAELADALSCADAALYRSKQSGRAEVFTPSRDDDSAPQSRPPVRTRDLDITPVPVLSGMDGAR